MGDDKKNNKLVAKHNDLIQHKGRMSAQEAKLFNLIVVGVREQQKETLKEYEVDISLFKELTKDKNIYSYLQETALKLESRSIIIERINENGKRVTIKMRLIYRPEIVEGSSTMKLHLDKELIPCILNLKKHFTSYQIENILHLNSSYSIKIYELLKQEEYKGFREFEVKELRKILGIEKDEYKRFSDFERWTLKVAKEEINKLTDINIDYEKIKRGRRIHEIKFKIEAKDQEKKIYIDYLNEFYNIKEMKSKMGLGEENFNAEQIMSVYEKAVEKAGNEDIDLFEYIRLNYLFIKPKARNKYSYLLKALENDYASAIGQISLDYYIES